MTPQDREPPPAEPAETPVARHAEADEQAVLVALIREAGGRLELDGMAWFLGPDGRIWRETP